MIFCPQRGCCLFGGDINAAIAKYPDFENLLFESGISRLKPPAEFQAADA